MNALVLANGKAPGEHLFEECCKWAHFFIAADGGGNTAHELGQLPNVVIGDLDSYRHHKNEPYNIIHEPDQYSNDLEKALKLAFKKNATHVRVLGATGYRLDHTLKNLSVLKQFNNHFKEISFRDDQGITRLLPKQYSEKIAPGTSVSLFPLSGKVSGITTSGLKFSLKNESIENGVRDGSSNMVTKSPIHIEHKKGDLLLFIAQ